jgi:hypothetical protein
MYGQKIKTNSGITGYGGLFWGSVSNEDGSNIEYASDFFFKVEENGKEAWDIINDKLHLHLHKHIGKVDRLKYHWQCGFGGDEMDGLLDFWLPTQIECPPDMKFKILGEKYVMSFNYGGDDLDLSPEEQDEDNDY